MILLYCISIFVLLIFLCYVLFYLYQRDQYTPPQFLDLYVVHLPDNEYRKQRLLKRFQNEPSIHFYFYNAVDTRKLKWINYHSFIHTSAIDELIHYEKTQSRKSHKSVLPGAIGCFLSHITLYQLLLKISQNDFFILEDDTIPYPSFVSKCHQIRKNYPKDADIVLLDYFIVDKKSPYRLVKVHSLYYVIISQFLLTNAYLITKKGIQKILKYFQEQDYRIKVQFDFFLSQMIYNDKLKVYGIFPKLCEQDGNLSSDIQQGLVLESSNYNI